MAAKIFKTIRILYSHYDKKKQKAQYFVIPVDKGRFMVYVPLKGICSLVNKEFIDKINTNDKTVRKLFRYIDSQRAVPKLQIPRSSKNTSRSLVLYLTTDCNMRCIYCYVSAGEKKLYMPFETAKAAIDYSVKKNKHGLSLSFHGGEPTLAFGSMQRIYDYAKSVCDAKKIKLSASCLSNGIFNENFVKWAKKNNIQFSVSIDGPKFIHDKQRPLKNGKGSLSYVERGIKLLNKYKLRYEAGPIITNESLPYMLDIVRYIHEQGVNEITISPMLPLGRADKKDEPNGYSFFNEYIKCLEYANKKGFKLQTQAQTLNLLCSRCSAMSPNHLVVLPDGNITACHMVPSTKGLFSNIFIIGKIEQNRIKFYKNRLYVLRKRTVSNIAGCKNCISKWTCAGNCMLYPLLDKHSIYETPREDICAIDKNMLRYLLLKLLKSNSDFPPIDCLFEKVSL